MAFGSELLATVKMFPRITVLAAGAVGVATYFAVTRWPSTDALGSLLIVVLNLFGWVVLHLAAKELRRPRRPPPDSTTETT